MNVTDFPTMASTDSTSLQDACEIMPGRLFYLSTRDVPRDTAERTFFSIDPELCYEPFYADFGPLNLAMLYRFCNRLVRLLRDPAQEGKRVYYCSSFEVHKHANAAYLIASFAVLYLHKSPEEAHALIASFAPSLVPFRDASYGSCTYKLTVMDCLRGLTQAVAHGFIDLDAFDADEYQFYERVENGDFNWIVPGKFLAFAGPHNARRVDRGYPLLAPEDYFEYFRRHGVTDVVRLNKKQYEASRFASAGFAHHELFFIDGSKPPEHILAAFLDVAEASRGVCAVHCKAGLGRTGSLIACYLMKHHKFTAREAIAWLRICRPGSVIGPQQYYLEDKQAPMWEAGQGLGTKRRDTPAAWPRWSSVVLDARLPLVDDEALLRVREDVDGMRISAHRATPPTPESSASAARMGAAPSAAAGKPLSAVRVLLPDTPEDAASPAAPELTQGDRLNQQKLLAQGRGGAAARFGAVLTKT